MQDLPQDPTTMVEVVVISNYALERSVKSLAHCCAFPRPAQRGR